MVTGLAIAIAAVVLAAAIACLVLMSQRDSARRDVDKFRQSWEDALSANKAYDEQISRREQVIFDLKKEVAELEKDLDAIKDPTVVRDRLRRMLGSSTSAEVPGTVPVKPSA